MVATPRHASVGGGCSLTPEETVEVRLPAELCQSALERFGSQFDSVEALVTFILNELLRSKAMKLDEAERRMIEARLKDLGYM